MYTLLIQLLETNKERNNAVISVKKQKLPDLLSSDICIFEYLICSQQKTVKPSLIFWKEKTFLALPARQHYPEHFCCESHVNLHHCYLKMNIGWEQTSWLVILKQEVHVHAVTPARCFFMLGCITRPLRSTDGRQVSAARTLIRMGCAEWGAWRKYQ